MMTTDFVLEFISERPDAVFPISVEEKETINVEKLKERFCVEALDKRSDILYPLRDGS